jgi:tRNA dimethylallyltransferase
MMLSPAKTDRPRLVIIAGPTGTGKSGLALELAEEMGGEIVSADSMQVYRYMDIGTAKPSAEERRRVRHHLVDVVTPDQSFHAGLYRALGRRAIDELYRDRKRIWVAGGTGLYIKTLTQGLFASPKAAPEIRDRLKQEAQERGDEGLYQRLKQVDPAAASRLHSHDRIRVIRALEVFEGTGVPISFYQEQHRFGERPYLTLKIGLEIKRRTLYQRIDQRVDRMVEEGFLGEVESLMGMGYAADLKPMQSLGYKQMVQYLEKRLNWDEAIRQIKRDTRHYAKRQWTWFKADSEIHWYDPGGEREKIVSEIRSFLGDFS